MSLSITWHGHATFTIRDGATKIVVDPFFRPNNPSAKISVNEVETDVILLTHGHGDHVADAVGLARRTGAKVIANFEIVNWLNKHGVENTHGQHIGGGFRHTFGHVKMTPALHGSMLPDGSNGGNPGGFLLTLGDKRIYIAGDTGLFSDMRLIGVHGIDVAILPIGDNYTMGPDDALLAIGFVQPRIVIPCHYNTWPPIAVNVHDWARRVAQETAAQAVILDVEQVYAVS